MSSSNSIQLTHLQPFLVDSAPLPIVATNSAQKLSSTSALPVIGHSADNNFATIQTSGGLLNLKLQNLTVLPGFAKNAEAKNNSAKKSEKRQQIDAETWTNLDRLKVASMANALTRYVHGRYVQSLPPLDTTNFFECLVEHDLVACASKQSLFDRKMVTLTQVTHTLLEEIFKWINSELIDRDFEMLPPQRIDRQVLRFVCTVNTQIFMHENCNFQFVKKHEQLAREYVFSALSDGDILSFQNVEKFADIHQDSTKHENVLVKQNVFENVNDTDVAMLHDCTDFLFRKYKYIQLLENACFGACERDAEKTIHFDDLVERLCQFAQQHGQKDFASIILHRDRTSTTKRCNQQKVANLCASSLTNVAAATALLRCGFFAHPTIVVLVLHSLQKPQAIQIDDSVKLLLLSSLDKFAVVNALALATQKLTPQQAIIVYANAIELISLSTFVSQKTKDEDRQDSGLDEQRLIVLEQVYNNMFHFMDNAYWKSAHKFLQKQLLERQQYFLAVHGQHIIKQKLVK